MHDSERCVCIIPTSMTLQHLESLWYHNIHDVIISVCNNTTSMMSSGMSACDNTTSMTSFGVSVVPQHPWRHLTCLWYPIIHDVNRSVWYCNIHDVIWSICGATTSIASFALSSSLLHEWPRLLCSSWPNTNCLICFVRVTYATITLPKCLRR